METIRKIPLTKLFAKLPFRQPYSAHADSASRCTRVRESASAIAHECKTGLFSKGLKTPQPPANLSSCVSCA